jgi:hypothetical protein
MVAELLVLFMRVEPRRDPMEQRLYYLGSAQAGYEWREYNPEIKKEVGRPSKQSSQDLWSRGPQEWGMPLALKRKVKRHLKSLGLVGDGFKIVDETQFAKKLKKHYGSDAKRVAGDKMETVVSADRIESASWDEQGNGGGRTYSLEFVLNAPEKTEWIVQLSELKKLLESSQASDE